MLKKITLIAMLICILFVISCKKQNIMDTPIEAENFDDFMNQISKVCQQTGKETCKNMKAPIFMEFPKAKTDKSRWDSIDISTAKAIYERLNGKTPSELIQIYKDMLLNKLEAGRKRDEDAKNNLKIIQETYDKTKKYAADILADSVFFISNNNKMELHFNVINKTEFTITRLAGEAEFYSMSNVLLGSTKIFSSPIQPNLQPKGSSNVKVTLNFTDKNDISLINAANGIKIKVIISSVQTTSKKEETLILTLPKSYNRMKKLLADSEKLYNETVKKINSIDTKGEK